MNEHTFGEGQGQMSVWNHNDTHHDDSEEVENYKHIIEDIGEEITELEWKKNILKEHHFYVPKC